MRRDVAVSHLALKFDDAKGERRELRSDAELAVALADLKQKHLLLFPYSGALESTLVSTPPRRLRLIAALLFPALALGGGFLMAGERTRAAALCRQLGASAVSNAADAAVLMAAAIDHVSQAIRQMAQQMASDLHAIKGVAASRLNKAA